MTRPQLVSKKHIDDIRPDKVDLALQEDAKSLEYMGFERVPIVLGLIKESVLGPEREKKAEELEKVKADYRARHAAELDSRKKEKISDALQAIDSISQLLSGEGKVVDLIKRITMQNEFEPNMPEIKAFVIEYAPKALEECQKSYRAAADRLASASAAVAPQADLPSRWTERVGGGAPSALRSPTSSVGEKSEGREAPVTGADVRGIDIPGLDPRLKERVADTIDKQASRIRELESALSRTSGGAPRS